MELDALDHSVCSCRTSTARLSGTSGCSGWSAPYEDISGRNPAVLVAKGTGVSLFPADIKYVESDHRVSRSLYVNDPDLHLVEITTYETHPEKASVWKKPE